MLAQQVTRAPSMPPKKALLPKADLRQIIHDHGLRLKGWVTRDRWPKDHKHHFQAIYDIGGIRYETYKADKTISTDRRRDIQIRVDSLTQNVQKLLNDWDANEATWRDLEVPILKVFGEHVLCKKCNNELWKPDYEAKYLDEADQSKLDVKRLNRKMCGCKSKQMVTPTVPKDGEDRMLFSFAKDQLTTHASDDNLQKSKVSMKPDRIIGLQATPDIPRKSTYFPTTAMGLLLPFLIVEAKKEENAPGFRAIQHQTSFPIRRFLKAQDAIRTQDSSFGPCLVWFFGYQGDMWRLHICIKHKHEFRIYDLWTGTIQSQDGALQLLLIVDYIWSWARDIYRPNVRRIIFDSLERPRDHSPASSDRFRKSVSIISEPTPAPAPQDIEQMDLDGAIVATGSSVIDDIDHQQSVDGPLEDLYRAIPLFNSCSSFGLLRWATGHKHSPSWSSLGCIRHSNIVNFEFRCWTDTEGTTTGLEVGIIPQPLGNALLARAFKIPIEEIYNLGSLWTSTAAVRPERELREVVSATFFFQSYCDPTTWKICRVLTCVVWSEEYLQQNMAAYCNLGPAGPSYQPFEVTRAILDMRYLQGSDSVMCALSKFFMILQFDANIYRWLSMTQMGLSEELAAVLDNYTALNSPRTPVPSDRGFQSGPDKLVGDWIFPFPQRTPDLRYKRRDGYSMIAIRSSSWPSTTTKYCLFVLPELNYSMSNIHPLLEEAVKLKNIYVEDGYIWSHEDWKLTREWRRLVKQESESAERI